MGDVVEVSDNANLVVEEVVEEETVFQVVEQQPEFPGGMKALMKYLQENIQYPRISRDNNSQGRALIRFVVNTDGSIQGAEVMKSSGDIYLDKEAVRVVSGMPKWSPGKQSGKAVRVYFVLPVVFRLQ
jgi:protein TonB